MPRPIIYLKCPVCSQPVPSSQFNRKKTACSLCARGATPEGIAWLAMQLRVSGAGRPPTMRQCPVCGQPRRLSDFNKKRTACLPCVSLDSRVARPVAQRIVSETDRASADRVVRSLEAQEAMDRGYKEFAAKWAYDKCSCCPHAGPDVGEEPVHGILLCELCWWDVQHVGQCQQHKNCAADPDPPIIYPEKRGNVLPEMPFEMQLRWGLAQQPGPPLTPEQIAADGDGD
jgi:hypothetical protein